jgi:S-adenosylmethionine-diacylglycerol 3-amino-3-carboxypropyl transferase
MFISEKPDWSTFNKDLGVFILTMVAHTIVFILVSLRMTGIVQDVYTEHFIMHSISKKTIIYNISWEDPREEREALGIKKDEEVILTISSAGCNVLDYLIEGPKAIVACDFNVAQLAVLELKLECLKKLTHAQFWAIWAESDYKVFCETYKVLRPALSEETRMFWDDNGDLIRDNFMFAGTSGLAAKLLVPVLRFLA